MSCQEKKSFLTRYHNCERAMVRLEGEISRWQSHAERMMVGFDLDAASDGELRRRGAAYELERLNRELCDRLAFAAQTRREIGQAIGSVGEERLRLLLEYRYVDELTYDEIAERMHYSARQIVNLHDKALALMCIA